MGRLNIAMNSICKEKIVPDNSQPVEFCPISKVCRIELYLDLHIKTLCFCKHCGANRIQFLHVDGLNTMDGENCLHRLLSSLAVNIDTS